jgi:hypothetical protein
VGTVVKNRRGNGREEPFVKNPREEPRYNPLRCRSAT